MLIGVSSVGVFERAPDRPTIQSIMDRLGCTAEVSDLTDGRVCVKLFRAVEHDRDDLVPELHALASALRAEVAALGPE